MKPRSVSVSVFGAKLEEYVQKAQKGAIITVTEQGRPIAMLVPRGWKRPHVKPA